MKPGSFIIGGVSSEELNAVITNWFDTTIPARRLTLNTDAVGVDQAAIYDDGVYENRTFTANISFRGVLEEVDRQISKFIQAIDGKGYVDACFYFDQDYVYKVVRTDAADVTRLSRYSDHREVSISFSAKPFKYLAGEYIVQITKSASLMNPTGYISKPLIKLMAKGDTILTINNKKIEFTGLTGEIYLDSEIQDAWSFDENGKLINENSKMSHVEFPKLEAGLNKVILTNGTIEMNLRWRSL
ncbi:putative phage tail protein [Weissella oryzae SG25]|uniref:Putative phage tail protein n=1 Tax=Weissella oryzae (strain DSM 25784 / JCM 18191 / LMG 30913 / SG25) TaxID=1329250 RepID=A0A069CVZ7_WEIOS|nr:hypothetical protein [Weissella oryzae]GAK31975.1 putative phage tail protein [Weissella oryzae SG25]